MNLKRNWKSSIFASVIALMLVALASLPALATKTKEPKSPFGAIAYSMKTTEYGIGAGDNKAEAQKNAMDFCKASSKSCVLVATDCTCED